MVQCEVMYFMVLHNILVYTSLLPRGNVAWLLTLAVQLRGEEYSSHGIFRVLRRDPREDLQNSCQDILDVSSPSQD